MHNIPCLETLSNVSSQWLSKGEVWLPVNFSIWLNWSVLKHLMSFCKNVKAIKWHVLYLLAMLVCLMCMCVYRTQLYGCMHECLACFYICICMCVNAIHVHRFIYVHICRCIHIWISSLFVKVKTSLNQYVYFLFIFVER